MERVFLLLILSTIPSILSAQDTISLKWELGYSKNKNTSPRKFIPATVPGAVQLDIAKAEKYGQYYYGENWKDYLWMEDQYYTYHTTFKKPDIKPGESLYFISKGIDYQFEIYLNNEKLFYQEGMFTWVKLDLTGKLKKTNEIRIVVYPVPKKYPFPANRGQAADVVKPAVSYGWDFHPRLVPLGIWDETFLKIEQSSNIEGVWVNYELNQKLDSARLTIDAKGANLDGNQYTWKLLDEDNKEILNSSGKIISPEVEFNSELVKPNLWWPNDQGTPYLYSSVFELKDNSGNTMQTVIQKVGFRRVKLVMNSGSWDEPQGYPRSRSNPPAQFEINGRRIFAKGSNWVPPEIFPGTITRDRYNELLDLAVEANFNILRVWGGGIVNKESFYELCDEKGILIWQEFPLACNKYPDDPLYLKILGQEARSILLRLKKHPSLALWCGGNELFNNWSGMDDQSLPLRLLNSLTLQLDPSTPFIPTSPLSGMAHGDYVFRDTYDQEEVFQRMEGSHYTAYTEFGVSSPSSINVLKKIIPADELWPPKLGTSWESHHAFKAWIGNTWLMVDMLTDYFGSAKTLDELVDEGQWVQSEGLKAIYEEARRQKPHCAMALNWCFDEPWYTAANNSVINYPASPKPGFYAVRDACRPFCASAAIKKFKWNEGEEFSVRIWLLNDLYYQAPSGKVIVKLIAGNDSTELLRWEYSALPVNANLAGPTTIPIRLPEWNMDRFKLVVEMVGKPEYSSEYTLLYERRLQEENKTKVMNK
jgi:beta-mannosidase